MCFCAELAVDQELGVEAGVAVLVGGEGLVVPRERVLEHRPRRPRGGEPALRRARRHEFLRGLADLLPRRRRLRGVEAGLLEGVLVVVEDRARRVERHRVEVAVLRVVGDHRLDEVAPVDGDLLLLHELVDRMHRARHQHGLGAHVEELDDVGRILLPVGGDGRGQDLGVGPLVERLDLELRLALVELADELVHRLAELAAHGVPEVDLGPGERGSGRGERGREHEKHGERGDARPHRLTHGGLTHGGLLCGGW